jgi:hypothetical protein
MDPDRALQEMLLAYRECHWSEAVEQAEALLGWLRRDGFSPRVSVGALGGDFQFDCPDEWFNRTVADALARKILQAASYRLTRELPNI